MPKPRLNAREVIHDVRAGFDDMDLMEKSLPVIHRADQTF